MSRILVIDDHAATRAVLTSALAPFGHDVILAAEGSPLDAARNARPDLVISDIFMPSGDGYELVQMLRRDPQLGRVPVIFYTAHFNRREAVSLARACGVTCVLTKPTAPEDILRTVNGVLAGEQMQPGGSGSEGAETDFLRIVSNKLVETAGELEWASSRLMALVEMCLELTAEREPAEMVKIFSRGTRDLVAARHSVVALWEPSQPSNSHVAVSGLSEEAAAAVEAGLTSPTPHPTPLAATGPLRRSGPVSDADDLGLPWPYPPVRSMLVVPVKSASHQYGWVCATSRISGDTFTTEDERLLTIFSAYLARVFENYCLLAQLSQRSRELELEVARRGASQWRAELQCAVANALAGASTLQDAAPQMLRAICTKGGFALADLWEIDEANGRIVPVDSWHEGLAHVDVFQKETRSLTFRKGEGLPGRVWNAEVPVWIANLQDESSFLRAESAALAGLRTAMGFPVVVRGRISGVLCVFGQVGRPPDADLISLFQAVGGQVGQFIERRRQEDRLVRLSRTHAVLAQAGNLIGSEETRRGLFRSACRIAVEDGGFASAQVFARDEDGQLVVAAASDEAREGKGAGGAVVAEEVFRTGEPVFDSMQGFGGLGDGALAALPLAHGGRVRAVLMLHADATQVFSGTELVVIKQMAADVSLALDALESRMATRFGAAFDAV